MSFSMSLARVGGVAARTCIALAALASMAAAQAVTVHGDLEQVGGEFTLSCTPLTLVSDSVDLTSFVGMNVVATGTVIGTDTLSVETIATDPTDFELTDAVSLGGTIDFEVTAKPGTKFQIWVSEGDDFNVIQKQALFLDPADMYLLLQGTVTGGGNVKITFHVPNDPTLAGVDVSAQVVFLEPSGGFTLGDADCVTIQP